MQENETTNKLKTFAPHPGKIIHHYKWNGKDEVVDADGVPDEVKFIYYDKAGQQVADSSSAEHRVPVVETDIVSMDKNGHPVDPRKAVNYSMTDYGPGHRELRHTTAVAPSH